MRRIIIGCLILLAGCRPPSDAEFCQAKCNQIGGVYKGSTAYGSGWNTGYDSIECRCQFSMWQGHTPAIDIKPQ